jgi:hypothetical protein
VSTGLAPTDSDTDTRTSAPVSGSTAACPARESTYSIGIGSAAKPLSVAASSGVSTGVSAATSESTSTPAARSCGFSWTRVMLSGSGTVFVSSAR